MVSRPIYREARSCTRICELESGLVQISAPAPLSIIQGVEKTADHLREIPLEGTNFLEGNIDKTMFAASFHELGYAAISIYVHHDEEPVPAFYPNGLTQEGDFSRMTIRFNNNAGYGGTH